MIACAPSGGPRWLLADWLELEALCTSAASTSIHAINADSLLDPDTQSDDIDEDGQRDDERLARVSTEVEARVAALREAYPFRMTSDGGRLECSLQSSPGSTVYLFCLLASHGRANGFLTGSDVIRMDEVPDLLQACATWSAAGHERGPAYALGLGSSASTFLSKLKEIYTALGDGKPVDAIPPGAPANVNDDGVDVIAWKATPHQRPPSTYLLAQVASGQNWKGKSLKHTIDRFHSTWFAPAPACKGNPAIMIPYCIDGGPDDDEDLGQAALETQWRRLISEFGEPFYRYSMPYYAALGLELHSQGVHVDMADWRTSLETFVRDVIANLQAKSQ